MSSPLIPPYKHPIRKDQAGIPGNDPEESSPLKAHQLTDAVLETLWLWYFCHSCHNFASSLELTNSRFWASNVAAQDGSDDLIDLTVQENGHGRFRVVVKWLSDPHATFIGLELQSRSEELCNDDGPSNKRPRLLASSTASSHTLGDRPTFDDFKERVFTTMREQALNLYGPEQQFDPYELYGIREYLRKAHAGNGASLTSADALEICMDDAARYRMWYNEAFQAIIMQEENEFENGSQKHKIGVSFKNVPGGVGVGEIRQENVTVSQVSEEYLKVFEKAAETIAKKEKVLNKRQGDSIFCELCWLARNAAAVFRCFNTLVDSHTFEFRAGFCPSGLAQQMYNLDQSDAGGLGRSMVTTLLARIRDPRCKVVKWNSINACFESWGAEGLSLEEKIVYDGIGSMLMCCYKNGAMPFGDVFSDVLYKAILLDSYDLRHTLALDLAASEKNKCVDGVIALYKEADIKAVRDLADANFQYTVFEYIHYEDEDLFPNEEFPEDWAGFWDDDHKWIRAKHAIMGQIQSQYVRQILPLECIAKRVKAIFSKNEILGSFAKLPVTQGLNIQKWHEVAPKIDATKFLTFRDACFTNVSPFPCLLVDQASLVQAAVLKRYSLGALSGSSGYRSTHDGSGNKWKHGHGRYEAGHLKYNDLYVKVDEAELLQGAVTRVRVAIQGRLDREKLASGLVYAAGISNSVKDQMEKWIRTVSSDQELEAFVQFVTGSTSLIEGQHIRINQSHDTTIRAHTCFLAVDMPAGMASLTEDEFFNALVAALTS